MRSIIAIVIVLALPCLTNGQGLLNKVKNKVNSKVNQRVENKIDTEIDKTLDELEGKKPASSTPASTQKSEEEQPQEENTLQSYSKFDFIPGEQILYAEDFQQDEIGEFPLNWNTAGKGEVVTLSKFPGKWLRMYENSSYLTSNKTEFSKNFTIEFDVVFQLKNTGYTYPIFSFGFLASNDMEPNNSVFLDDYHKFQCAEIYLRLGEGRSTYTYLTSHQDLKRTFTSENLGFDKLEKAYNQVSHIAIQVQEKRMRVWVNGEKKFDLPMALPTLYIFNQLFFRLTNSSYNDDQLGFYLSNIKVATGKPDTRHKLIDEGRFSTTGILFDFQSATIKPESHGVIKDIAGVLKEHGSIKVKVIGHTSSDGDDAANLELSKKRAAAVKDLLVSEFGIDAGRIETEGKGETEPAGDNKTKEGKALNRRVEFVKI